MAFELIPAAINASLMDRKTIFRSVKTGKYISFRKQTLSLPGFLSHSVLILRSAYPPSYLLAPISQKYEISNANMKFFRNSGQFSRLVSAPPVIALSASSFSKAGQQLPQISQKSQQCESKAVFSQKPQNHSGANEMMDP